MAAWKLRLGADPEFFAEDVTGKVRSAIGKIGGNKEYPLPLQRMGYAVQEDNVAVEFNIPPAENVRDFVESIEWSLGEITRLLSTQRLKPRIVATEIFPPIELAHPQAAEFGCDPDFNAWLDGGANPKPYCKDAGLRSAGGHIHVSVENVGKSLADGQDYSKACVKAMDLFLGVPSVMMDTDERRRALYGKAGAFRFTTHAPISYEYRVLSNFWIKNKQLMEWAYTQSNRAVEFVLESGLEKFNAFLAKDSLGDVIQQCINTGDVRMSNLLITDYKLAVV